MGVEGALAVVLVGLDLVFLLFLVLCVLFLRRLDALAQQVSAALRRLSALDAAANYLPALPAASAAASHPSTSAAQQRGQAMRSGASWSPEQQPQQRAATTGRNNGRITAASRAARRCRGKERSSHVYPVHTL